MKEGWSYKKLGEVFPIVMGKTPSRNIARYWDKKKETGNRWVSIADLSKNEGREILETKEHISDEGKQGIKLIPKGSLLVSFKLTLGKMAFAGIDLYTNEAIMSLGKRKDMDLMFLFYYFSYLDWHKIASGNEKVKGKTLNKKSLSEIPVPCIPLSEQHSIVSRLDAAFSHIDARKANAEKQLNEARKLFQAELTECMKPKEGWEEKKLGEVGTFSRGINFAKNDFVKDGYPCIHYGQIHTTFGPVTYEHLTSIPNGMVRHDKLASKGNLIIAITSEDVAGSCKCTAWMGDYDISVGAHAAIYKHELNPIFMSYYFKSSIFQQEKEPYVHGFKVMEIKPSDIAKIPIVFPSKEDQQIIVSHLDSLSSNIRKLEELQQKTIAECDALKQAMLREVFE